MAAASDAAKRSATRSGPPWLAPTISANPRTMVLSRGGPGTATAGGGPPSPGATPGDGGWRTIVRRRHPREGDGGDQRRDEGCGHGAAAPPRRGPLDVRGEMKVD